MTSLLNEICEADSLPEWVHPYVAALIDNHASIVVSVTKSSNHQLGYRPKQELRYKGDKRGEFDILKRYCTEYNISPRITEQSKSSYQRFKLEISSRNDLVEFLAPLRPYLIQQNSAVQLLLDVLIPGLNGGAHSDRGSFVAWMQVADEFREQSGKANRTKYDLEYFCTEWDIDPEAVTPQQFEWGSEFIHQDDTAQSAKKIHQDSHNWIDSYVAALIDIRFNFVLAVSQQDARAVGYKIMHKLQYKTGNETISQVIESYFKNLGIEPHIKQQEDTKYDRYKIVVLRREDISTLLNTLYQYIMIRQEAVDILLNKIIPALDVGAHGRRDSFIKLMGDVDAFRKAAGRANRTKYDQQYFLEEWDIDMN